MQMEMETEITELIFRNVGKQRLENYFSQNILSSYRNCHWKGFF